MTRAFECFALGGLIGAGIGLLLAPCPGKEMRELISKDIDGMLRQAKDFVEQTAEGVYRVYEAVARDAQRSVVKVEPVFRKKTDEIHEHIEKARERIICQAAKTS